MLTVLKEEQYSLSKVFQINIHHIKQNSAKNTPNSRTHSCNESDDGKSSYRLWNDLLYEQIAFEIPAKLKSNENKNQTKPNLIPRSSGDVHILTEIAVLSVPL